MKILASTITIFARTGAVELRSCVWIMIKQWRGNLVVTSTQLRFISSKDASAGYYLLFVTIRGMATSGEDAGRYDERFKQLLKSGFLPFVRAVVPPVHRTIAIGFLSGKDAALNKRCRQRLVARCNTQERPPPGGPVPLAGF